MAAARSSACELELTLAAAAAAAKIAGKHKPLTPRLLLREEQAAETSGRAEPRPVTRENGTLFGFSDVSSSDRSACHRHVVFIGTSNQSQFAVLLLVTSVGGTYRPPLAGVDRPFHSQHLYLQSRRQTTRNRIQQEH